ncbi:MAG: PD-(D/E)XK nuclease family protein, partial [Nanoarchaeota archaeon]
EKKIYISLDKNEGYMLIGYIDRLVHNKETNIFEIHDYKTGSLKSQRELDEDRQLAIYSLGIKDSFENAHKIKLVWHFFESNQELTSERTIEQLQNLKNEILNLIKKIELTKEFLTNKSNLCNWCEYKSKCPEFIRENLKEFI